MEADPNESTRAIEVAESLAIFTRGAEMLEHGLIIGLTRDTSPVARLEWTARVATLMSKLLYQILDINHGK